MLNCEEIKSLDMVEFLSRYYGLAFSSVGREYACLSPFNDEQKASFFVGLVDGHWLFHDFSSGHSGSLIDFVQLKEGFSQVSEAMVHIGNLLGRNGGDLTARVEVLPDNSKRGNVRYDVSDLYERLRHNNVGICRDYLLGRGIGKEIVEELVSRGVLVHNRYRGQSYCCFAVFDGGGELCCLDNHQIDGDGKFVLGKKSIFSLDWEKFPHAERLYVTEGIIDYLSIKTLEGMDIVAIALLGNMVKLDPVLFESVGVIISALDVDVGGFRGFLQLQETFPDKEFCVYDFSDSKDANEYLQSIRSKGAGGHLSGEDKLLLYKDYMRSENKSEVARRWGINRSYMYEVVRECESLIVEGFSGRRVGRRREGEVSTLAEASERIKELEQEKRRLGEEKERYYARSEFLKIRLKYAQQEGEESADVLSPARRVPSSNRKKHLKKKRRKR
jgi:transposase-like protein